MTVFVIKLFAACAMLIDHLGYALCASGAISSGSALYLLMRAIGRISFPLFCFLLVNGFEKTSDRGRYLLRLLLFALLSQIPFNLLFTASNYFPPIAPSAFSIAFSPLELVALLPLVSVALVFRREKRLSALALTAGFLVLPLLRLSIDGIVLFGAKTNVFYTLALGLALICLLEKILRPAKDVDRAKYVIAFVLLLPYLLLRQPNADYGLLGAALIVMLYLARRSRAASAAVICLWSVVEYLLQLHSPLFALTAALAALGLCLYGGKPGIRVHRAFYLFYPLHLAVLSLIFIPI